MQNENIKKILKQYGLTPNFTYGQNFLDDEKVLSDIVSASKVKKDDVVLEIGPGLGDLTRRLCKEAGFVLSVEKDEKFLPILKSVKKDFSEKFSYDIADILEYNFQQEIFKRVKDGNGRIGQDGSYKVVANIPYYITGKILEMFLTSKFKPTSITVLTQREVAERVVAKAGGLSVLAISVQIYGEPKIVSAVSKNSFYPVPKVDSAILHIDLFKSPKYKIVNEKKFFHLVKQCFAGKRKQLHNTLVNNLGLDKNYVMEILLSLKIDPAIRPQGLTIEDWVRLAGRIYNF